ncbi:hypothetical protein [Arthrobacter sp. FW306-07-I]|uniref:hypothetical protein n=1 Tax=Arthrobacter sp. FW306-07-I TaxID=2879622 RepID=UPI001F25A04E|nr:hypothetical protein [Arthrobacter sp. FW306-07-I]UKA77333.1 hypothetical protein LFT46_10090 [Arthrobacter sp. FW306-07-I]
MQRNKSRNARRSDANGISFPVSGLVGAAVVTLLCGCSASDPQKASNAATPAQTVASQAAAPPGPIASVNNGGRDKTADFKTAKKNAPWLGKIKSVTETEPGKIRIETSLVDPRGADGSEEAKSAITICESVVSLFGPSYISVLENDGTTFVLFGHPTVPSGACAEV